MSENKIVCRTHDLWPTRIWAFELSGLEKYTNDWMSNVLTLREQEPFKPGYSMRGGWHSDRTLFSDLLYKPLVDASRSAFREVFKAMEPMTSFRFRIEAWANIQDKGGFNVSHIHANSLLSGCYYLKAPEGSGELVFRDPRIGTVMTGFPGKGWNCPRDFRIKPKTGHLLVFPHWLEHLVEPHTGNFERISIAMNAVGTGK